MEVYVMFDLSITRPARIIAAAMVLVGLIAPLASAQLPQLRIYSVFPPGGQTGATTDLKITGGTDMDDVSQLLYQCRGRKRRLPASCSASSDTAHTCLLC